MRCADVDCIFHGSCLANANVFMETSNERVRVCGSVDDSRRAKTNRVLMEWYTVYECNGICMHVPIGIRMPRVYTWAHAYTRGVRVPMGTRIRTIATMWNVNQFGLERTRPFDGAGRDNLRHHLKLKHTNTATGMAHSNADLLADHFPHSISCAHKMHNCSLPVRKTPEPNPPCAHRASTPKYTTIT